MLPRKTAQQLAHGILNPVTLQTFPPSESPPSSSRGRRPSAKVSRAVARATANGTLIEGVGQETTLLSLWKKNKVKHVISTQDPVYATAAEAAKLAAKVAEAERKRKEAEERAAETEVKNAENRVLFSLFASCFRFLIALCLCLFLCFVYSVPPQYLLSTVSRVFICLTPLLLP